MKPIGLYRRGGRVPKSSFFEKPTKTMSFLPNAFQSTLLKPGLRSRTSRHPTPTPTPDNFDYPTPTPTPTPGRLRPSAVLVT